MPDLAVATTSGIDILYNTGWGGFGAPDLINKTYFSSLAVGDFNGDGRLDLVAAWLNPPNYSVQVILHNVGRGFAKPVPYAVVRPLSIVVGDFNRDDHLDLAVLNYDDSISILLGNGDGTFQPQTNYITGSQSDFPTALLAVDVNGDGILDLARAAADYRAGVGILIGNGDGTFQPVQINGGSSFGVVAGDFNGDGKLDLAVGANGATAGILVGNGDGTFQPVEYFFISGFYAALVAAGDFDQDGRLDLALSNYTSIDLLLQ
jgi:hypothetical protein